MLIHNCSWRASDSDLPPAGNTCGPYSRSALWGGKDFYCNDCKETAPEHVTDVALLAMVLKR